MLAVARLVSVFTRPPPSPLAGDPVDSNAPSAGAEVSSNANIVYPGFPSLSTKIAAFVRELARRATAQSLCPCWVSYMANDAGRLARHPGPGVT